jgi:hypothetical protein
MQTRPIRRLAAKMAQERRLEPPVSYPKIARKYGITTPKGKPNPGMVKRLIDGYQPRRPATLARIPIPPVEPKIHAEPIRRVLIGAWKLDGRWVGPEEYFGSRA